MKILAFGDTHGSDKAMKSIEKKAKQADLLVCIGDVTVFEQNFRGIMKRLDKIGKKILMIHGNHEDDFSMLEQTQQTKNIYFLHRHIFEQDDYTFIGFGGGGFSLTDSTMKKFFMSKKKELKDKKIVMLTHAPAYKTKIDDVHGASCGCKTVRWIIERFKPKFAFAGHLHENFGKKDKIKGCEVINPGPFGMMIHLK
mgnify:CR=1 FL=1|tara:strand:+ start:7646 stop:8236 length:591 start_codon:yes stop_codon:yes gene_type:complete